MLRRPWDEARAADFGFRPVALSSELTLFPLCADCCDYWADALGVHGSKSKRPVLNTSVVHELAKGLQPGGRFAVIETDYFGGVGDPAAMVYEGDAVVMEPRLASLDPISEALRHLGVRAYGGKDEFDTVNLGRMRSFEQDDSPPFTAFFEPWNGPRGA